MNRGTRDARVGLGLGLGLGSACLHVFVLASFAVAQPLFDLISRHGEFLLAHRSGRGDILLLALLLIVGPGLVLCALELAAAAIHRSLQEAVHRVLVGLLAAAILLPIAKRVAALGTAGLWAVALLGGAAAALLYARQRWVRQLLTLLAPAPLAFAAYFLFVSPVSRLIRPARTASVSSSVAASRAAPVVFVIFDELPLSSLLRPDGEIDAARFPNFARLRAESTWFRNATTVHDLSEMAVPAMLTGRFADPGRLPFAGDYPFNLFTLLGPSHRLEAVETLTRLCPEGLCGREVSRPATSARMSALLSDTAVLYLHLLLPVGSAARLPRVDQTWGDFGALGGRANGGEDAKQRRAGFERHFGAELTRDQEAQFESFLGRLNARETPALYFLHLMVPHVPWLYLPDGKHYAEGDLIYLLPGDIWPGDDIVVAHGLQRYLLQLRFADHLLGRIVEKMRSQDLYDRSLLVVASDHGASFRPGQPRRRGSPEILSEILPVPLFVKKPHQERGVVDDRNAEIIDVVPTIAQTLGIAVPWRTDGDSLFEPERPGRIQKSFFPDKGNPVRLPGASLDYSAAVRRIQELFPRRADGFDLYAFGGHARLVGLPTGGRVTTALPGSFTLTGASPWEDYRASSLSPGRLIGELTLNQRLPDPWNLAFAVNGRIGAATRAFQRRGSTASFSAVVPESLFRPGRNEVALYMIREEAGGARLAPIRLRPALRYLLTTTDDQDNQYLQASDGRTFLIAPGAVWGSVDGVVNRSDVHTIIGWAADVTKDDCADAVVAVLGETSVATGTTDVQRSDVASYFDTPELSCAGFALDVPVRALGGRHLEDVRLFAIVGTTASELKRQPAPGAP